MHGETVKKITRFWLEQFCEGGEIGDFIKEESVNLIWEPKHDQLRITDGRRSQTVPLSELVEDMLIKLEEENE